MTNTQLRRCRAIRLLMRLLLKELEWYFLEITLNTSSLTSTRFSSIKLNPPSSSPPSPSLSWYTPSGYPCTSYSPRHSPESSCSDRSTETEYLSGWRQRRRSETIGSAGYPGTTPRYRRRWGETFPRQILHRG